MFDRDPGLVVATARSADDGTAAMAADFRDQEAWTHVASGAWVCVDARGEFRLGAGPIRMVDGVWRCSPHPREPSFAKSLVSSEALEMRPLE